MFYFAYGANMNLATFTKRCEDAAFVERGVLERYSLLINTHGVGTIVPDTDSCVYGIVWKISEDDEVQLDWYEGVESGYYQKTSKSIVSLDTSNIKECLVYVATDERPGSARGNYLIDLRIWSSFWKFPREYQNYIASL
jgi:hypothetical protein